MTAGGAVLGAGAMVAGLPTGRVWAQAQDVAVDTTDVAVGPTKSSPDTAVKGL